MGAQEVNLAGSPPNAIDLQVLEDIWHGEAVDYLTLQILVARCMA